LSRCSIGVTIRIARGLLESRTWEFLDGVALPFLRAKWQKSTALTTGNRIQLYLKGEFGERRLINLALNELQSSLNAKTQTLSRSVVAHLRWDWNGWSGA
jgi:hypothetical protein